MEYNVILEGCDCVGKTSIANIFSDLGFTVKKYNAPKYDMDAIKQYADMVQISRSCSNVVFDRGMLGEVVYGPLKRGYDTSDIIHALEQRLSAHTLLVLVTADIDTIIERFDGDFITVDEIPVVVERFKEAFNNSRAYKKMIVDTTNKTPFECYVDINNYATEWLKWL